MGKYDLREPFDYSMTVLSSTRRPTTVKTWAVTDLQQNLTPSFIMTPLLLSFHICLLFALFVQKNDDCLGQKLAKIIPVIPVSL